MSAPQRNPVYILSAVRTPIGRFGGVFKGLGPVELGAAALRGALEAAGIDGGDLDGYAFGNVLRGGHGQLVPRQAAIRAGIPDHVDGFAVDMVCSSGMMSLMTAAALIAAGEADVMLAGGVESMSNAGFHLSARARWGYKMLAGAPEPLGDLMMTDGLTDPFSGEGMGIQAERLAAEYGIARAAIDEAAARSHQRAAAATQRGDFAGEIIPVEVKQREGPQLVAADEGIRPDTTAASLAALRPAFAPQGVLTAGNSSQISDGAAALVLAGEAGLRRLGAAPLAVILGSAWSAGATWRFPEAPIPAVRKLLDKLELDVSDFGLFENNEAFALNNVLFTEQLGVSPAVLNVRGGAVALGHPIGASGARITVTLLHALREIGAQRGMAAICHGTGGGTALALEMV